MNNFYNSGLYSEPFFRKHKNLNFRLHSSVVEAMLESDYELFLKDYSAGLDCQNEDELQEAIISLFVENINLYATYFEPLIFDKEIALECGLTPFKYSELNLLALSGCGMDFSPRLDAYQVLTDHTIDKASYLFLDISYFEYVVGDAITEQIREILCY